MRIEVQLLDPEMELPSYAKPGDAGLYLRSRVEMKLEPGMRALVPTGIAVAIPTGYVGLVHPRSGLAIKSGISMVNTPGTIDSGYRGEISVILINHDREETFEIKRGDRIAQLVIQQVEVAELVAVKELPLSERGEGGFGSSGIR